MGKQRALADAAKDSNLASMRNSMVMDISLTKRAYRRAYSSVAYRRPSSRTSSRTWSVAFNGYYAASRQLFWVTRFLHIDRWPWPCTSSSKLCICIKQHMYTFLLYHNETVAIYNTRTQLVCWTVDSDRQGAGLGWDATHVHNYRWTALAYASDGILGKGRTLDVR